MLRSKARKRALPTPGDKSAALSNDTSARDVAIAPSSSKDIVVPGLGDSKEHMNFFKDIEDGVSLRLNSMHWLPYSPTNHRPSRNVSLEATLDALNHDRLIGKEPLLVAVERRSIREKFSYRVVQWTSIITILAVMKLGCSEEIFWDDFFPH